jgi:succinyl-diaminopimelate desuccinylase
MARFLSVLEREYPTPAEQQWCTTVNVSAIRSDNSAYNKIPDQCEVQLDIRFLPSESEQVLSRLQAIVPAEFQLEIIAQEPALFVEDGNYFVTQLRSATQDIRKQPCSLYCAQGSSDARHYTRVGDSGVEFGPIGGGIGADEEWIEMPSLQTYCDILKSFLKRIE